MSRVAPYLLAMCIGLLIGVSVARHKSKADPFGAITIVQWTLAAPVPTGK